MGWILILSYALLYFTDNNNYLTLVHIWTVKRNWKIHYWWASERKDSSTYFKDKKHFDFNRMSIEKTKDILRKEHTRIARTSKVGYTKTFLEKITLCKGIHTKNRQRISNYWNVRLNIWERWFKKVLSQDQKIRQGHSAATVPKRFERSKKNCKTTQRFFFFWWEALFCSLNFQPSEWSYSQQKLWFDPSSIWTNFMDKTPVSVKALAAIPEEGNKPFVFIFIKIFYIYKRYTGRCNEASVQ